MYPVFTRKPGGVTVGESGPVVVSLVYQALLIPFVVLPAAVQIVADRFCVEATPDNACIERCYGQASATLLSY